MDSFFNTDKNASILTTAPRKDQHQDDLLEPFL